MTVGTPLLLLIASLFLLDMASMGWGCLCKKETPEHNYCKADWVAHVMIVKRQDGVRMPAGIVDRQTELNARHEVKYMQMYKISPQMNITTNNLVVLPINVYTALEDAACGILLEPGTEYLLAGQYVNGTMMTRLCGQILLEDLKESRKHDILQWSEVPEKTKQQLAAQQFDAACKKEAEQEAKALAQPPQGQPTNQTKTKP